MKDGINWAIQQEVKAGTYQTGHNTFYVPMSPGECQSFQVANHYKRKIGQEVYQFYLFKAKLPREERMVRVSFVKRGNEWFFSDRN